MMDSNKNKPKIEFPSAGLDIKLVDEEELGAAVARMAVAVEELQTACLSAFERVAVAAKEFQLDAANRAVEKYLSCQIQKLEEEIRTWPTSSSGGLILPEDVRQEIISAHYRLGRDAADGIASGIKPQSWHERLRLKLLIKSAPVRHRLRKTKTAVFLRSLLYWSLNITSPSTGERYQVIWPFSDYKEKGASS